MPIYEYQCEECGHKLEKIQKIADDPLKDCPSCSEPALKKLVSAAVFRLKGGGWYETDFKTGSKKNVADGDGSASKSDSAGEDSSSGGSDSSSKEGSGSSASEATGGSPPDGSPPGGSSSGGSPSGGSPSGGSPSGGSSGSSGNGSKSNSASKSDS